MALIWCDGFEGYGVSNGVDLVPLGVFADKYSNVDQENTFTNRTAGRHDYAFECSSTLNPTQFATGNIATGNTVICGIAFNFQDKPDWQRETFRPLFRFENAAGNFCGSVTCSDTGLYFRDAVGDAVGMTRANLTYGEYHYVEAKIFSDATSGTVEIRVNGCPILNLASVNTLNTGGAITNVMVGYSQDIFHKADTNLDDYYVCDGSGSTNNDFLGDVTVRTLYPDGDNTTQFSTTGNGGYSTHYEQVNYGDALPASDWVEDASTGNRDIYTMDDSTDNFATVFGVVGWVYARYDTGASTYHIVCDSNGTESESGDIVASSVYRHDSFILENDPDIASAWTDATINAVKFGFEVQ
jgi:hypothetical protein